jgi:hypothetical protein
MAQFRTDINSWKALIPLEINSYLAELSAMGIQELSDITQGTSTVDSGAYLVSHMVVQGDGIILYEASNRPSESELFPSQKAQGLGPIFDIVDDIFNIRSFKEQILKNMTPGTNLVTMINLRPYSQQIEYGSIIVQPPRRIYGTAEDRVYVRLAEKESTQRRLNKEAGSAVTGVSSGTQRRPAYWGEYENTWNLYWFPSYRDRIPDETFFSAQYSGRSNMTILRGRRL